MVSGKVVRRIVEACSAASFLEIGPGPGVLTEPLARIGPVVAVDADPRMVEIASEAAPTAQVHHADALKLDWISLLEPLPQPRAIVSNMPYNITGPLLEKVWEARNLVSVAVLMMQREVGERILALPGDSRRGALSVVIQRGFEVTRVCNVPAGCFAPPPRVESVVLRLVPKPEHHADERQLAKFVRRGFSQPRKKLSTNLGPDGGAVAACGLNANVRPHQVGQDDWERLFNARLRTAEG